MDARGNRKPMKTTNRFANLVWEIKKGDLVQLKEYPTGREDECVHVEGIVISDILEEDDKQQIPIWPSVHVYVFKGGAVRRFVPPSSIEILSNS
jgi:hypothetical protein